jgi:hypothetical protein
LAFPVLLQDFTQMHQLQWTLRSHKKHQEHRHYGSSHHAPGSFPFIPGQDSHDSAHLPARARTACIAFAELVCHAGFG